MKVTGFNKKSNNVAYHTVNVNILCDTSIFFPSIQPFNTKILECQKEISLNPYSTFLF